MRVSLDPLGQIYGHLYGRYRKAPGAAKAMREHPVVHDRHVTATALTLWAVALGVLIGIRWGVAGLACYLPWLPFAFILLWESTTALRFDERQVSESSEGGAPERAYSAIAELRHSERSGSAR